MDPQIAAVVKNLPAPAAKVLEPSSVFHLRVSGLHARAVWTDEGMAVLEGSDVASAPAASLTGGAIALRQALIASGVLVNANEKMILNETICSRPHRKRPA